ncbi:MAG: Transcriptional regulator, TetR family [Promethearchaeota archaeon]|nr:MAG: Transcriptional regulator, TetR family [Candidatus Lokiarchaeota archaeon]
MVSSKGFKDTKDSENINMAEIAMGTFHNYYPSKDVLFMEIFLEENLKLKKLKKKIMDLMHLDDEPIVVIKQIMILNTREMKEKIMLREWYNKMVFDKIVHNYRQEKRLDQMDFLYQSFLEIVKKKAS